MNHTQGILRPVAACQTHFLSGMTSCVPSRPAARRRQTAISEEEYRSDVPPISRLPSPPIRRHSPESSRIRSHLQLVEERPLSSAEESFSAPTAIPGFGAETGSPATACRVLGIALVHWDQAKTAWGIVSVLPAVHPREVLETQGTLPVNGLWTGTEGARRDGKTNPGRGERESGSLRPEVLFDQVQGCEHLCSFAVSGYLPEPCRVMLFRPSMSDPSIQHGANALLGPDGRIDVKEDQGNHDC